MLSLYNRLFACQKRELYAMENTSRNTEVHSNSDACSNTVFDHHRFDENFDVDLQELGKDWIPECSEGLKPYIDQCFSDLDQAFFFFYKEYGRSSGLDVRRSTERSDKDGTNNYSIVVRYCVLLCVLFCVLKNFP
nr:PREDICTED: uncharacterized protein LOC108206932 isoform X3 [Daucus carota subsp. sativus]